MVLIDTVYQRVLALANKEQRGYITPQEFNLFANQAQLEILDQYMNDVNYFNRTPGNSEEYADMSRILDEKLGVFKTELTLSAVSGIVNFPVNLYKLGKVYIRNGAREADQLTKDQVSRITKSRLTAPNQQRPVFDILNNQIRLQPAISANDVVVSFVRKPISVNWGYVVINNKALYDPNPAKTTNFELHDSEETELVYKILKLSGAAIQRNDIAQFAQGMEQGIQQSEKV
tara:strand:+ start:481 stop:1173 length:693 start_codon:yes stop_codon:yes gene_type:complete